MGNQASLIVLVLVSDLGRSLLLLCFSIDKTGSAFGSCSLLVGAGAGASLNEQLPEEEKHKPETRGQCVMVKENWS